MAKIKAWKLQSESILTPDDGREQFLLADRVIELYRTHGLARWIILATSLVLMASLGAIASVIGIIIAFVLWCGLVALVNKLFTSSIRKRVHPICYVDRDETEDCYLAMDLDTKEFYFVRHVFPDPNDDEPATVFGFEPVTFWDARNYLCNRSDRIKAVVEDIRFENRQEYFKYQFGESSFRWIKFLHKQEGDKHKLACMRIDLQENVQVRYLAMSNTEFQASFAECSSAFDMYKKFVSSSFDSVEGVLNRMLTQSEKATFNNIYNGDKAKSEEVFDMFFCDHFIRELESSDVRLLSDVSVIAFLAGLPAKESQNESEPETLPQEQ